LVLVPFFDFIVEFCVPQGILSKVYFLFQCFIFASAVQDRSRGGLKATPKGGEGEQAPHPVLFRKFTVLS
jgi:hypothetical protein